MSSRIRAERTKTIWIVAAATASAVIWAALFALGGWNRDRAVHNFVPVVGMVYGSDHESDRLYIRYEYKGEAFDQAFQVFQTSHPTGKPILLLVNPQRPSEARIQKERFEFLPGPLAEIGMHMFGVVFILTFLALVQLVDYRGRSRRGSPAPEPDIAPAFAQAAPVSPAEQLRSALNSPRLGIEFAGRSRGLDHGTLPAAEQLRAVAAAHGCGTADPNLPLLAQPVLLVQHFRVMDSWLWAIWLPDGTLAGAIRRSVDHVSFMDREGTVLATLEAPRQYQRAQGPQTLKDGSGAQLGLTEERGFRRRALLLGVPGTRVAKYRKRSLNHATITDSRGGLLADITCHRVPPRLQRPFPHVLLVRFTPTEGPLRTLVFTNAVMAFRCLQIGRQYGGA